MARHPRPKGWSGLLHSRMALIVGIFVLLLASLGVLRELVRRSEIRQEIAGLESQISDLESRRTTLTNLIDYFSSPLFQEEEARKKLGLAKTGEEVVIVPLDETNNPSQGPETVSDTEQFDSNPRKWWRYFFLRSDESV